MIYKEALPDGEFVRVTFEMPSSVWAERVNLVGDFNDWDTARDEMQQSRTNGNWRITLALAEGPRIPVPLPGQRPRLAQRLARGQVCPQQVRVG